MEILNNVNSKWCLVMKINEIDSMGSQRGYFGTIAGQISDEAVCVSASSLLEHTVQTPDRIRPLSAVSPTTELSSSGFMWAVRSCRATVTAASAAVRGRGS